MMQKLMWMYYGGGEWLQKNISQTYMYLIIYILNVIGSAYILYIQLNYDAV